MLKPMLARGELHCIGATTLDEYRKYIEKDAALERRFQPSSGRAAERRRHDLDPARAARALRSAPRRADPRPGAGQRRDACRTVTSRSVPTGQGDRPRRRGLRDDPHRDRLAADRARHGERVASCSSRSRRLRWPRRRTPRARRASIRAAQGDAGRCAARQTRCARNTTPRRRRSAACVRCARSSRRCAVEQESAERRYDMNKAAELKYGAIPAGSRRRWRPKRARMSSGGKGGAPSRLLREEVTADEIAQIVARWTGIPVTRLLEGEREKPAEARTRSCTTRHRPGRGRAGREPMQCDRARSGIKDPKRPIGSFLFLGPDRRRQDGTRKDPGRNAVRQRRQPRAHRHVGVHGEARGARA